MRHGIFAAVVVCGLVGAMLAPGCDQLGLGAGGAGGYGGEACGGAGGYGGDGGAGGGAACVVALNGCEAKCQADYDAAALECAKIDVETQRKTCQDSAYQAYKQCMAGCASCTDMYTACQGKGSPCTKNIGGKTLCAYCLDNCLKKEPYKFSQCYSCGFSDP